VTSGQVTQARRRFKFRNVPEPPPAPHFGQAP